MQTVNILDKGQIVISAELRPRDGITPGARLEIREAADHLEIYALPDGPIAAFRGSRKAERSLADELIQHHLREVERDGSD